MGEDTKEVLIEALSKIENGYSDQGEQLDREDLQEIASEALNIFNK